uniref:Chromosome 6 open reading frame 89 n=1 Tax=Chrysolophus pictus TaxID=9089 RepID=A0A8C3PWC8_CHRPC
MELSANELSIYDKLSETIDLVRQTGHQCGMSEKAIEKFIKQLLERNEPQRGPPRYPVLVAIYKGLLTLGLVLLTVYFVIQPYSPLPPETPLSRAHAWGSLIGHIRLLSLPIAKKYMLEKCQDWWAAGCRQNTSTLPANCTACSTVKSLQIVTDIGELSEKLQRSQPFLIKTGQSLSYEELKHFQSQDPELAEIIIEENSSELWSCLPRQSFPFFLPWNRSVNRTQILQEFFPTSSLLSFPKTVSLENCFLIRHPDLGNKVRNSSWSHCLPDCELSFRSSRPFGDLHVFSSFHCCVMWHLKVAVPPRTGEKACCAYLCAPGTQSPPPSAVRNACGVSQLLTFMSRSVCAQLGTIHLRGTFCSW